MYILRQSIVELHGSNPASADPSRVQKAGTEGHLCLDVWCNLCEEAENSSEKSQPALAICSPVDWLGCTFAGK